MLYKPTSVSPNSETVVVSKNNEGKEIIRFNISGISSSKILNRIRTSFSGDGAQNQKKDDSGYQYIYTYGLNNTYSNDLYNVTYAKVVPSSTTATNNSGYYLYKNMPISYETRLYEEDSFKEDKAITDDTTGEILDSGYHYEDSGINATNFPFLKNNEYGSMDLRAGIFNYTEAYNDAKKSTPIYGDDYFYCTDYIPTAWIGYGEIQDYNRTYITDSGRLAKNSSSSTTNSSANYYMLKIFPHNIPTYFAVSGKGAFTAGNDSKEQTITQQYIDGYDTFLGRYYIKIAGYYFKILDFRYYDWRDNNSPNPSDTIDSSTYFDGYGNALAMYVLIKNDVDVELNGTYTIYSNYIDTDSCAFEISDAAEISFKDIKFPDTEITFYSTEDEAMKTDNIYNLQYSNIELSGTYYQNAGAYLSKYNISLYQIVNGNQSLIDRVTDRFSQSIYYNFSDFRNAETYLLVFEITNSKNVVDRRCLCIRPDYGENTKLISAEAIYNKDDNSIIVDYGKAFSVYPEESIEGAYEFKTENNNTYLSIGGGNTLTYDKIDGKGDLEFTNVLCNIVLRTHKGVHEDLFSIVDDNNNTYSMEWDGVQFVYTCTLSSGTVNVYKYSPTLYNISAETNVTENPWLSQMLENMSVANINTSVPYLWNEAFNAQLWDDDLFVHVEEQLDTHWYSIVVSNEDAYFYNLTGDTEWHTATKQ